MRTEMNSRGLAGKSLLAAAFLAGAAFGAVYIHRAGAEPEVGRNKNGIVVADAPLGDKTRALGEIENGFAAIAERLEPSVVSIEVQKSVSMGGGQRGFERLFGQNPGGDDENNNDGQRPRVRTFTFPFGGNGGQGGMMPDEFKARGSGSGVVVRSDGWILTNDHVVEGADKVTVTLHDGRVLPGTVRRDKKSDLAVVKVEANDLKPIEFADSDKTRVGQWAIAFGSPFELNDTMTVGIISARQRQKVISDGGTTRFYPNLIQTDASINPGNSGGALVDSHGMLVGINVAINSPTGSNVGIGFAIPSNSAHNVMEQLIKSGHVTRGFMGINPVALTPKSRKDYNVQSGGALITAVTNDTPASRAGFQVEDVVVKFDGKPVRDDIDLRERVARTAPNTRVDVVVIRNGREQTLGVTVGSAPDEPKVGREPAPVEEKAGGKLGIQVAPITDESSKQFKLEAGIKGALVAEVKPGSAAAEAGIQPGDVITKINGKPVNSAEDLKTAVQSLRSGDEARVVIQRGRSRTLVTAVIP